MVVIPAADCTQLMLVTLPPRVVDHWQLVLKCVLATGAPYSLFAGAGGVEATTVPGFYLLPSFPSAALELCVTG
jgi:hypothetical protein